MHLMQLTDYYKKNIDSVMIVGVDTPSVPICNHPFDFIVVRKCKPLFKLLVAFIYFFPKHTLN